MFSYTKPSFPERSFPQALPFPSASFPGRFDSQSFPFSERSPSSPTARQPFTVLYTFGLYLPTRPDKDKDSTETAEDKKLMGRLLYYTQACVNIANTVSREVVLVSDLRGSGCL